MRWVIIPEEEKLPPTERMYCPVTQEEWFSNFQIRTMFINNTKFYLIWTIPYLTINFAIFGGYIRRGGFNTLYGFFWTLDYCKIGFTYWGPWLAPFAFMMHHFIFFTASNFIATLAFYSKPISLLIWITSSTVAIKRGAHIYTGRLANRLEGQLKRLETLEDHIKESEADN